MDLRNDQVAEYLKDGGRDFLSADTDEAEQIARAIAAEIERRLQLTGAAKIGAARAGAAIKQLSLAGKLGSAAGKMAAKVGKEIAGAAYIEGMEEWQQIVLDRIRKQITADGGKVPGLKLMYRKWKLEKFGFAEPVGVATGQLKDNLDPSNKGNVRLRTGLTK